MIARLVFALFFLFSSTAFGQAVQLITPDEAKLPAAGTKPPSRAITRGPGVKLASPDSVSGQFAFKVDFSELILSGQQFYAFSGIVKRLCLATFVLKNELLNVFALQL